MLLKLSSLLLLPVLTSAQFGFFNDEPEPVPRSCHLPTGVPALCVPLAQCAHLSELVANLQKPLPGDVALLIRDSYFCETDPKKPALEVCCPLQGISPPPLEGPIVEELDSCTLQDASFSATCAVYSQCSPFIQLLSNLRRPFPKEIPDLMQKGWMCGFESVGGVRLPKVCCPTDALKAAEETTTETPVEVTTPDNRVITTPEPLNFFRHKNRAQLAPSKDCGQSVVIQERIVGGQDAKLGQYPWLANLGYSVGGSSDVSFKCGGSLVGPRYVITAAHCVTNLPGTFQLVRIRLGEHTLSESPDCEQKDRFQSPICNEPAQDFNVEKIIHHESYNSPNPFQNDVALVKLDRPAVFNDWVRPVCLPFNDDEDDDYQLPPAPPVILTQVAGWGATNERGRDPADTLQYLTVNVTDPLECRDVYKSRGGRLTPGQQMCAGGRKGLDSCVGDSGSALMREDGKLPDLKWKLLGVVSFGPRLCGTEGIPGVYTRIRFYLDWILDNAEP